MPATAQIIPFPARLPAAAAEPEAAERLARAIALLDAALAEQRAAVASWRDGLSVLQSSVAGLDGTVRAYHAQLNGLRGRTEDVHSTARRLETWADAALRSRK